MKSNGARVGEVLLATGERVRARRILVHFQLSLNHPPHLPPKIKFRTVYQCLGNKGHLGVRAMGCETGLLGLQCEKQERELLKSSPTKHKHPEVPPYASASNMAALRYRPRTCQKEIKWAHATRTVQELCLEQKRSRIRQSTLTSLCSEQTAPRAPVGDSPSVAYDRRNLFRLTSGPSWPWLECMNKKDALSASKMDKNEQTES